MIELIEVEDDVVNTMNIGKRIRKLRLEKDWTMYRLAQEANISETAVHNAEYGKAVNFVTVTSILDALGCELALRRIR